MDTKYLHDALVRSVKYHKEELCEPEEFMEDDIQVSLEWEGKYINYKKFEIRLTKSKIPRQDSETPVYVFNAAVGYELLENSIDEAEQLAKDYIDVEEKKLCRIDDMS